MKEFDVLPKWEQLTINIYPHLSKARHMTGQTAGDAPSVTRPVAAQHLSHKLRATSRLLDMTVQQQHQQQQSPRRRTTTATMAPQVS